MVKRDVVFMVLNLCFLLFCPGAFVVPTCIYCTVHYALSNGANDEVISLLLQFHPNSARGCDNRGWTP